MTADEKLQFDLIRVEVEALKAKIAVLEEICRNYARMIPPYSPSPYEYVQPPVPTWWPYKGPTCAGRTITCTGITAHEAPPSDPSPACPSPTSGAGGGT